MVTTRVTWIYPTATVEQRQEIANYVAGYESNTNSALMDELNAKAIELANGDTTVGSSYDIEEDIAYSFNFYSGGSALRGWYHQGFSTIIGCTCGQNCWECLSTIST